MPISPQTNEKIMRECYGTISRYAEELARAAELQKRNVVHVKYEFLKTQMERLKTLERNVKV